MPEDDNTMNLDEAPESKNQDPLGIIGWEVGGKYEISAYLGGGGFGEVYEGFNKHLREQKLVFKFFKRVQSRSKFVKEAKILCLLDHPNISKVIDFLPEEGALVVAHIGGKDGGLVLKENGPLDEKLFLKVARAMSSSIAYAHEQKIAHRDLKPSNIMFDQNNNVYLIDFGIAKEMGGDATKTAYQALTPLFAAPERQSGDSSYNPFLSDIYELGVTLFNLATNNLPYRNPANPNLAEWGGMSSRIFSSELREILIKSMHPDPTKRYQTARELAQEFESLNRAYGGVKKRRSVLPYIAILALLLVAGYFGRHKITEIWQNQFASGGEATNTELAATGSKDASDENSTNTYDIAKDTAKSAIEIPVETTISDKQENIITEESGTKTVPDPEKTAPGEIKSETASEDNTSSDEAEKSSAAVVKPDEYTSLEDTTVEMKAEPSRLLSKLILDITPRGKAVVMIDGSQGSPDSAFTVEPGRHTVSIIHQDFPVYEKNINVSGAKKTVTTDLGNIFKTYDSVSLQVSLIPSPEDIMIQLKLNGRGHTLRRFPAWDIERMKGVWQVEAGIYDVSGNPGTPKIDSIVVNPYDSGPGRGVLAGSRGTLTLGSIAEDKMESVPMLIFWSKK
jgi:serine/threonine protein kinase